MPRPYGISEGHVITLQAAACRVRDFCRPQQATAVYGISEGHI